MSKKSSVPNQGGNKAIRLGDYVFFCDLCGHIEYASKATKLEKETGHGNAIVCPDCRDSIDYHFVPFKPRPEQSIPWARPDTLYSTPPNQLYQKYPSAYLNTHLPAPGFISQDDLASVSVTWEQQIFKTWDQWLAASWDKIGNK